MNAGSPRRRAVATASLSMIAAIGATAAASALAAGCSAGAPGEATASSTSGALEVIDPALAASAQVSENDVSFPASSMAALARHQPGDVIVSPRVAGSAGNASGFLRKVTSTAMVDGRVVVTTEPAAIADVVADGTAHPAFDLPGDWNLVDVGETTIATRTTSLAAVDGALAGNELTIDAKLDSAHVELKPDLDFTMGFKGFSLDTVHFAASGTLAATAAAELDVKISGTVSSAGLAALQGYTARVSKKLWTSQEYNLPTVYIGIVPIEESVTMYLNAICWVSFKGYTGGDLALKASATASATIDGAIDYAGGTWTPSDSASVTGSGSVTLSDKATEDAICQVGPSFALKFYDAVGPELGVTAGLNVTSATSTWSARPDVRAWVQGDVNVLGYDKTFGPWTLYDYLGPKFAGH